GNRKHALPQTRIIVMLLPVLSQITPQQSIHRGCNPRWNVYSVCNRVHAVLNAGLNGREHSPAHFLMDHADGIDGARTAQRECGHVEHLAVAMIVNREFHQLMPPTVRSAAEAGEKALDDIA